MVVAVPRVQQDVSSKNAVPSSAVDATVRTSVEGEVVKLTEAIPVFDADPVFRPAQRRSVLDDWPPAPSGVPEQWAPDHSQLVAKTVVYPGHGGVAEVSTVSQWISARGHEIGSMPDDWGFEIDMSQFNDAFSGTDPFCPIGYNEGFFAKHVPVGDDSSIISWSAWDITAGGQPGDHGASFGAYFDHNTFLDDCGRKSIAVGIGYPQNVNQAYRGVAFLGTRVVTHRGADVTFSPISAVTQAVSNDCNDLGVAPESNCMDLNIGRTFPGPGSKILLSINKARGMHIPNCIITFQPDEVEEHHVQDC